jgi:hypothetical protein
MLDEINKKTLLVVIVVLVIILIVQWIWDSNDVYGMWVADEDYLADAGLNSAYILVGDVSGRGVRSHTHDCYALMHSSDDVELENQQFNMTLTPKLGNSGNVRWYSAKLNGVATLPEECDARVDFNRNVLTLLDGETVHLELFRNNVLTDCAKNADE